MRFFPLKAWRICIRLTQVSAVLVAALLLASCGDQYRAVITPVGTTGPAAQPSAYVIAVSATTRTTPGIVTVINYSGDSVMAEAPIGPGPTLFALDSVGAEGYTVNSDGTITNFPVSTNLQPKDVLYTTLPATARITNLTALPSGLWGADLTGNVADSFSGSPQAFKIAIPVAGTPIAIVSPPSTSFQRVYAVSQQIAGATGVECNASPRTQVAGALTPIEVSSNSPDAAIPVGKCPVFALESLDGQRLFVLNRGDDTISVINSNINTIDNQCPPPNGCTNQNGQKYFSHPSLPLSTSAGLAQDANNDVPAVAGPVFAEYNAATQQLVVADYDGGAISVIDVSLDQYGNDSPTFGTTYTIPVGSNPASLTVLFDGSRAYTANQANGTVTVVDLISHTVEKTLTVVGNPRTVVSIQNSQFGKVYVASPNSPYLTIIETQHDLIDTTVLLEGIAVDVHITTNSGGSSSGVGNPAFISRIPGFGQPCNLPGAASTASLSACQAIP
jgi:DNA-binding beta-propeller fold protein YncE